MTEPGHSTTPVSPSPNDRAVLLGRALLLTDQVAVVTGGASGLGLAAARALTRAGSRTVLVGRSPDRLKTAADSLSAWGSVRYYAADVAEPDQIDHVFAEVQREYGNVDVVFANAGASGAPGRAAGGPTLAHSDEADWRSTLDVNLSGVFHTLRAADPHLAEGGRVIVTSSIAGLRPSARVSYGYSASKAALQTLARQVALELAPRGVRVNVVAPGPFLTEFGGQGDGNAEVDWRAIVPLGRVGAPEEFEGLALYLASQASSFVTGGVFVIDGGATLTAQLN